MEAKWLGVHWEEIQLVLQVPHAGVLPPLLPVTVLLSQVTAQGLSYGHPHV